MFTPSFSLIRVYSAVGCGELTINDASDCSCCSTPVKKTPDLALEETSNSDQENRRYTLTIAGMSLKCMDMMLLQVVAKLAVVITAA